MFHEALGGDPRETERTEEMARRVAQAGRKGEVPRTRDGSEIIVLTEDRWWTTSVHHVTRYDVAVARSRFFP